MPKAVWNGVILAHSSNIVLVDGSYYFPPDSLNRQYFSPNGHHTICPRKGTASYFDLLVEHRVNPDAAWTFAKPTPAAAQIAGYVAFWHGVEVV